MNPDKNVGDKQYEDCYFYLYSNCKRGEDCIYRHNNDAKMNQKLCQVWDKTKKCHIECPLRHSYYHIMKKKTDDLCFFETTEQGCTKPYCEFKHRNPMKDSWKAVQPSFELKASGKDSSKNFQESAINPNQEYDLNEIEVQTKINNNSPNINFSRENQNNPTFNRPFNGFEPHNASQNGFKIQLDNCQYENTEEEYDLIEIPQPSNIMKPLPFKQEPSHIQKKQYSEPRNTEDKHTRTNSSKNQPISRSPTGNEKKIGKERSRQDNGLSKNTSQQREKSRKIEHSLQWNFIRSEEAYIDKIKTQSKSISYEIKEIKDEIQELDDEIKEAEDSRLDLKSLLLEVDDEIKDAERLLYDASKKDLKKTKTFVKKIEKSVKK